MDLMVFLLVRQFAFVTLPFLSIHLNFVSCAFFLNLSEFDDDRNSHNRQHCWTLGGNLNDSHSPLNPPVSGLCRVSPPFRVALQVSVGINSRTTNRELSCFLIRP